MTTGRKCPGSSPKVPMAPEEAPEAPYFPGFRTASLTTLDAAYCAPDRHTTRCLCGAWKSKQPKRALAPMSPKRKVGLRRVAHAECARVPTAPRQSRRIPKQRAGRRRRRRSLQGPDGFPHAGAARACWAPPRGQRGTAAAQRRSAYASACCAVVWTAELARQRWPPAAATSEQARVAQAVHAFESPTWRRMYGPGANRSARQRSTPALQSGARAAQEGANNGDEQRRMTTPFLCSHAAAAFKAISPKLHGTEQRRWWSAADAAALRLRLRRSAEAKRLPSAGAGAARRTYVTPRLLQPGRHAARGAQRSGTRASAARANFRVCRIAPCARR